VLYTDGVLDAHAPARRLEPADLGARLGAARPAGVRAAVDVVAGVVAELPAARATTWPSSRCGWPTRARCGRRRRPPPRASCPP